MLQGDYLPLIPHVKRPGPRPSGERLRLLRYLVARCLEALDTPADAQSVEATLYLIERGLVQLIQDPERGSYRLEIRVDFAAYALARARALQS